MRVTNIIVIIILSQDAISTAKQIAATIPQAKIYGLRSRLSSSDVDVLFDEFTPMVQTLFTQGVSIIGLCAAGILIRTIAPLLQNKWHEPPVLAVAIDGSAVVPLLGGLSGGTALAYQIGQALQIAPAITTSGELRFQTSLLTPPASYRLINPEHGKGFIAELLAGKTVRLIGEADWLSNSELPIDPNGALTIQVSPSGGTPSAHCLVYQPVAAPVTIAPSGPGKLFIIGTGPGRLDWMTPEVTQVLQTTTDWIGYTTYLNLVEPLRQQQQRHDSDNREELDRARLALNLAATGRSVAMISSGDPGIYAMAAAVFEALETDQNPDWQDLHIQVCPGISAMQAAASQIGAPIGHDFCAISLSDILKPWEIIAQRIAMAAQADFVIAFYNPISSQRRWQLDAAKQILLKYRQHHTPIVLAKNVGRSGQTVTTKYLGDLDDRDADMRTVLLIGSSQTRIYRQSPARQWVYTPRTYKLSNQFEVTP
jgi:cobalt-precorrin 5A hydrolase / precorrin-3B C17-methyltransferase